MSHQSKVVQGFVPCQERPILVLVGHIGSTFSLLRLRCVKIYFRTQGFGLIPAPVGTCRKSACQFASAPCTRDLLSLLRVLCVRCRPLQRVMTLSGEEETPTTVTDSSAFQGLRVLTTHDHHVCQGSHHALAGFTALDLAAPSGSSGGSSTGSAQFCQKVENSSDLLVAPLVKALIGLDVSGLNIPIG
jgi:hypothetical protein